MLGENGAGKSTLMKIIYGAVKPDAGTIRWERQAVAIANPAQRARLGIGMVFQHFSLFETLTVADNIALALEGDARRPRTARAHPRRLAAKYGLPLDPAPLRAHDVGRRAPARRDRPLPAAGSAPADHGRADVGADAAGGARSCSRRCAGWRRKAAASCTSATSSTRSARCATRRRCCAPASVTGNCDPRQESSSSLARMMIGGDLPHPQHREARTRGDDALVVRDLTLARRRSVRHSTRRHQPHGARRRDRRHRRRLRQRPEGADGGAVGRAHAGACRRDHAQRRAGRRDWTPRSAARSASPSCPRSGSAAAPCPKCRSPTTRC